jgi:hypothetical protein
MAYTTCHTLSLYRRGIKESQEYAGISDTRDNPYGMFGPGSTFTLRYEHIVIET